MNRIAILVTALGAALFLGSLPLALRKVPRNRAYGFRTAISMASDKAWYDINARAGWWLGLGSLAIVGIGLAGWFLPEGFHEAYRRYAFFVAVGIVIAVALGVGMWSRRYSP